MITSTCDPLLLQRLLQYLQAAADAAPAGAARWQCLGYLADGLSKAGRPDASLPFYDRAAKLARNGTEGGGDGATQAWSGLAWISGNAAIAVRQTGDLGGSRRLQFEAADAARQAGEPAINVIGSELEALRIDVMQGRATEALPQIESRLAQVSHWRLSQRAGQPVADAPDAEILARCDVSALDVAKDTDFTRKDWPSALPV